MPKLTAAQAVDRLGFPTYARLYEAAETKARSRKRLDVVKRFGVTSLVEVVKSAIGAAVGVAGSATKAIGAVRDVGLEATAPLGAGFAGANFGIGIGVGTIESALQRTPPLDNYSQIEQIAMEFLDKALQELPCLEPPRLKGNTESARLTEKQLAKSSASAVAKEAAHQTDMLGRAWDQLAEVAEKPENLDRSGTPKWRKCRIASEVAGSMAWFQRKYNKTTYFNEKLIEDYCSVGGVFTVMEKFWRDNAETLMAKMLVAATAIGAQENGTRPQDLPNMTEIAAVARMRSVVGTTSGHLSEGTTNWRG